MDADQPCDPISHVFHRRLAQLAVEISAQRKDRRRLDTTLSHVLRESARSGETWLVIIGSDDEPPQSRR